ncbi:hypothetical protein CK218_22300 [Mesorhizobium sp. WSM3879]|nr:hypothetical protein CK218_22300 [Mesorhizobium sp. WSM3879]
MAGLPSDGEADRDSDTNGNASHQIAGEAKGPCRDRGVHFPPRLPLVQADQLIKNPFHSNSLLRAIPV